MYVSCFMMVNKIPETSTVVGTMTRHLCAFVCGFISPCGQIVMNMITLQLCKMQLNFTGVT